MARKVKETETPACCAECQNGECSCGTRCSCVNGCACSTRPNSNNVVIAKDKQLSYAIIASFIAAGFLGFLMGGSFVANHTPTNISQRTAQAYFLKGYQQGFLDGYSYNNCYYGYPQPMGMMNEGEMSLKSDAAYVASQQAVTGAEAYAVNGNILDYSFQYPCPVYAMGAPTGVSGSAGSGTGVATPSTVSPTEPTAAPMPAPMPLSPNSGSLNK